MPMPSVIPAFSRHGKKRGSYSRERIFGMSVSANAGERGNRCARHCDGTKVPGLDLRDHVEARGAHDLRRLGCRLQIAAPSRSVQSGADAFRHETMISRMKLHGVETEALGIEGSKPGRVLVGLPPQIEHLARAPAATELGEQCGVRAAAVYSHGFPQRLIAAIEINVDIGRRLIEDFSRADVLRHGLHPHVAARKGRTCSRTRRPAFLLWSTRAQPLSRGKSAPIGDALMNIVQKPSFVLSQRHLLGIEGLSREDILNLLDLAEQFVQLNRQIDKKQASLRGRTLINLFFEASTRTQASFELAGKRLGADVMNMSVGSSSMRKGETLIDTAVTLNAMRPDIIVVRHHASGAVELLARKVDCSVVNAGDGSHEHPTQALLDALTIRRNKGRIERLIIVICGDILHSRVARSNIILLNALGARVRVVAPSTLLPPAIERFGVEVTRDMREGLRDADIVMMLRLQRERMNGSFVPSTQEYFHYFGLDQKKLAYAKPDALVMHPGPMNRGVEIDTTVADGAQSLIREQVEMGVAVRMAVLEALSRTLPNR